MHRVYIRLLAAVLVSSFFATWASAARRVISLDGDWRIAQGGLSDVIPTVFDHTIAVPGLVDMAKPAFTEVGVSSPQRKAFWYKRTFTVKAPQSQFAILKVNKAQFGTKVWMNGVPVGEHFGCFTPGYFDVSKLLKYNTANTLVVRIGACRDSLPPSVPAGGDYEKTVWTPGIYDSVSLLLTKAPYISSVQIAPHITNGTITVQVALRCQVGSPANARLRFTVREWKTGHVASKTVVLPVRLKGTGEQLYTKTIRVSKPRLWSPESPFLYELRCDTGADEVETRFGMREFRYDAKNGRPMLNGRPYYLRGTNFCMFRFFEDPVRGNLPWNRQWVRKLLTIPKQQLHWNSARVCIAPFPEFWYDMADELGWLLQDEYPIWGFNAQWSQKELKTEFSEWLRERWNHPSIVVWDACNETLEPRLTELIRSVRGLDISNRPWDNGYSQRDRPTDAMETHPYTILPAKDDEDPRTGSALDKTWPGYGPPVVINEYDAFWMCRDGSGTAPFKQWYINKLGADATVNQKRELLAYHAAAVTEYWRARRDAAAIQWFCYLSYSKPGLVTSDNFADLPKLVLEPHFIEYMHNAFSPLAVSIDNCRSRYAQGSTNTYRIIITNDLGTAHKGTVALDLVSAVGRLHRQTKFAVKPYGQFSTEFTIKLPEDLSACRLIAELKSEDGTNVRSRRNIKLISTDEMNRTMGLADGRLVTASSQFTGYRPQYAVDGSTTTRWSSQFSDPQWIMVDLGTVKRVGRVSLDWETAYGKAYKIELSSDSRRWTSVYSTNDAKGGLEQIKFPPVSARYVRMYGSSRGTVFGYSLWEFRVFEE